MGFAPFCDSCGEPIRPLVPFSLIVRRGLPPLMACSDACAKALTPALPALQLSGPEMLDEFARMLERQGQTRSIGDLSHEEVRAINAKARIPNPVTDRLGPVDVTAFLKSCE